MCQTNNTLIYRDVNFSYMDGKYIYGAPMIVQFEKGNINVVSGRNGCGKSTLLNLALGVWDNYMGDIFIDDMNMKNMDKDRIRKSIIYGFQEPVIFNDTILNNITIGGEFNKKEVQVLADQLLLLDDINEMPQKFDTVIDRNSLSQGQIQKVNICRMLYSKRSIMIFDEPTSNLDFKSVDAYIDLIQKVKDKYLIIIISHDKKIISEADYNFEIKL
ncbi:ABC transporter ATP-binding protein [Clostridium sp. E02]|uniref:ATP-binding cassette domain-containing protein n=1 Tax=Clostridium sp. E02 TaxID=2487134 RepID=UPI000F525ACD|nr:ABC transporter ATP-binding protein [Clostridium sp. E02]